MADCRAFLDCNSVLHYRNPDEILWGDQLNANNPAVVISMSLLEEIDKKCWDGSPAVKKRAEARKSWLTGRWRAKDFNLRQGVLVFEERRHGLSLSELGLDPGRADDKLIAEVIASKNRDPGFRHVLITRDATMLILASSHGIECFELPPDMAQPIEDDLQKENRRLRQELQDLQSVRPEIRVDFETGSNILRVDASPLVPLDEAEIEQQLATAKAENGFPANFNASLEKYFVDLEEYLRKGRLDESLCVVLPIQVRNHGTAPAERVHVTLTFPPILEVWKDEVPFDNRPQPPRAPSPQYDYLRQLVPHDPIEVLRGPTDPEIDSDQEGTRVHYNRIGTLDQNFRCPRMLYVFFDHRSEAESFGITWEIRTASLPKPVGGKLSVVVSRTPTKQ